LNQQPNAARKTNNTSRTLTQHRNILPSSQQQQTQASSTVQQRIYSSSLQNSRRPSATKVRTNSATKKKVNLNRSQKSIPAPQHQANSLSHHQANFETTANSANGN